MDETRETQTIPMDENGDAVLHEAPPTGELSKNAAVDAMHRLVADYEDQGAYGVEIDRMTPLWCAGHCATIPVEMCPTVEEMRQSFGGHKFRIRLKDQKGAILVQKTIMISDVPKNDGEPIRSLTKPPPEQEEPRATSEIAAMSRLVSDLIAQQQQSARQQHQFLERLLFEQMSQRGETESPVDRISEMAEMIAAMMTTMLE